MRSDISYYIYCVFMALGHLAQVAQRFVCPGEKCKTDLDPRKAAGRIMS